MTTKEKVLELQRQIIQQTEDIHQSENKSVGNCSKDFQVVNELGRGSYGIVFKVISQANHQEYVMKKINIKHMKQKHQKEALKEAQILRKVRHPCIIKYYTSFVEEDYLYIVMEYADGGDLQQQIREKRYKKQHFSEQEIWDIGWNLVQAVDYLHKNNIIHRDIKTLNIFLTKDKKIKLGDLGVSKIVSSQLALNGTRVGTPLYLAPELVKQQPYDFKIDIWAIGCVLYHVAALEPPYQGDNLITLGFNIVHKQPKPLPGFYSPKLTNLISKFFEKSPAQRPTASEMLEKFPTRQQQQCQGIKVAQCNDKCNDHIYCNQPINQGKIEVYDENNYHRLNQLIGNYKNSEPNIENDNILSENLKEIKKQNNSKLQRPQTSYIKDKVTTNQQRKSGKDILFNEVFYQNDQNSKDLQKSEQLQKKDIQQFQTDITPEDQSHQQLQKQQQQRQAQHPQANQRTQSKSPQNNAEQSKKDRDNENDANKSSEKLPEEENEAKDKIPASHKERPKTAIIQHRQQHPGQKLNDQQKTSNNTANENETNQNQHKRNSNNEKSDDSNTKKIDNNKINSSRNINSNNNMDVNANVNSNANSANIANIANIANNASNNSKNSNGQGQGGSNGAQAWPISPTKSASGPFYEPKLQQQKYDTTKQSLNISHNANSNNGTEIKIIDQQLAKKQFINEMQYDFNFQKQQQQQQLQQQKSNGCKCSSSSQQISGNQFYSPLISQQQFFNKEQSVNQNNFKIRPYSAQIKTKMPLIANQQTGNRYQEENEQRGSVMQSQAQNNFTNLIRPMATPNSKGSSQLNNGVIEQHENLVEINNFLDEKQQILQNKLVARPKSALIYTNNKLIQRNGILPPQKIGTFVSQQSNEATDQFNSIFGQNNNNNNSHKIIVSNYMKNSLGKMKFHVENNISNKTEGIITINQENKMSNQQGEYLNFKKPKSNYIRIDHSYKAIDEEDEKRSYNMNSQADQLIKNSQSTKKSNNNIINLDPQLEKQSIPKTPSEKQQQSQQQTASQSKSIPKTSVIELMKQQYLNNYNNNNPNINIVTIQRKFTIKDLEQ